MPPSSVMTALGSAPESGTARSHAGRATCFRLSGGAITPREAVIAEEVPVALVYNGIPHVVMMTTPADVEDFALGFSLSEGLLATPEELLDLKVAEGGSGIEVRMQIAPHRLGEV